MLSRTRLVIALGLVAGAVSSASAQFNLAAGSVAYIEHGTYTVGAPGAGAPVFDANGFMTDPGANYPTVVNPVMIGAPFNGPAVPVATKVTAPAAGPPAFGGATTKLGAVQGANAGLLWFANTIRDNPANEGFGSYNVSGGNATWTNVGNAAYNGFAGVYMPFTGFVDQTGAGGNAYVASALAARITVKNAAAAVLQDFFVASIIASDGIGARADGVAVASQNVAGAFAPLFFADYVQTNVGNLSTFAGYGLASNFVSVPVGGTVDVLGRWTLLADPFSGADFVENLLPTDPNALAALPPLGFNPVPEPASLAVLGLGAAALIKRRRR